MDNRQKDLLIEWAEKYNDPFYFVEDPISFPSRFAREGATLKDIEIAAVFAAHFAWGRRCMIVRDCGRLFDEMEWRPADYVASGDWRSDDTSIHRTVKWSEVAAICGRLKEYYEHHSSLKELSAADIRERIFGGKHNPKAADKKIHMMRRWMIRNDGKVDLGLWKDTSPAELVIPLDVHVYDEAVALGLTKRKQKDFTTACEITEAFKEIWPEDPCRGDFALFGYGIDRNNA